LIPRLTGGSPGRRIGGLVVALACIAVLALLGVSSAAAAHGRGSGGKLVVKVSGLPAGASARSVLHGPHGFRRTVSHSQTFTGVAPGSYSVSLSPVLLHRAYKQIAAGSEAFPARRHVRVRLRPGGKAVAAVAYGTIRSSSVKALRTPILAVVGDPESPTGIVVSAKAAAGIAVGSILAQAPGNVLPHGLLDRVTGKSAKRGRGILSLKPASLWDAFPALDIDTTVPLAESVAPEGAAQASGLSAVDLGLGRDLIKRKLAASCGASPGDGPWSFAPSGSIQPSLRVEIHRHYLVVPYGELSLELKGSIGLDATLPKGVHCGFTVSGPGLDGVVPVAGVPVPVEGGVDFSISLQSGGPIQVKANLGVDATGGMTFDGPSVKPIADFKPKASATVTGSGGEVDLGPDFQVGIGTLDGNAHVGISPGFAAKGNATGCELDLKGSVGAGIDAAGWHPSVNSPSISKALYHCPALPSGPGPSTPVTTPGGGSSSGSWTIESVPVPPSQYSGLGGVSCPAGGVCLAVGSVEHEALIERRGPGGWTTEAGAAVPGVESVGLDGISCVSPSSCTAVGGQRKSLGEAPLIEHWNGVQWTVQEGAPAPGEYTDLVGVSCVDEDWCMAVGESNSGGESSEVAEHWDGSSWTLESLPSPEGSDARALSGVDCVGRGFCELVGGYDNDQGTYTGHAYAVAWNGAGWILQTVPGPPSNEFSGLAGVDCVSSSYCAAAGYWDAGIGTNAQPMMAGWNGSAWGNQALPNLGSSQLGGETPAVSCTSPTGCIAVGREGSEAGGTALALRWEGSSWAFQPTPAVPGAYIADLNDVSCVAASSCVAVGSSWDSASGPERPLVEAYSG
jgi:hypothetical protein